MVHSASRGVMQPLYMVKSKTSARLGYSARVRVTDGETGRLKYGIGRSYLANRQELMLKMAILPYEAINGHRNVGSNVQWSGNDGGIAWKYGRSCWSNGCIRYCVGSKERLKRLR